MRSPHLKLAVFLSVCCAAFAVSSKPANADPCGMVPPIYTGDAVPITRIGLQKTYVFYKDGIETVVIRPGFRGNVDEFGMLIPFPTPPALRKVSDSTFDHLVAAVDPPEVVVDLRIRYRMLARGAVQKSAAPMQDSKLKYEGVKVIKKEAVGMYEVVVLEAGSSAALKGWMGEHGYMYPKGMDEVCDDYVELGWCFVAVKTRVGRKDGVEPKPGQRDVDSKLPSGSSFDGHVQGMGFRFKVDELVVPMRLSAFNGGDLRNAVYLLTDGPRKIRAIPEEYVVRQVSGQQLFDNVTKPLPLRIIGGTEKDIPAYMLASLPQRRDPTPKNGAAKELFAADLLAVKTGELSLAHEEMEKQLLNIGENLSLRGPAIDKVNANFLTEERAKTVDKGLADLKEMTLTVVDGDFPREVISSQNLTFGEYKMAEAKNDAQSYDAASYGPGAEKSGVLIRGELKTPETKKKAVPRVPGRAVPPQFKRGGSLGMIGWLAMLVIAGGAFWALRGNRFGRNVAAALFVALLSASMIAGVANAQDKPTIRSLINELSDAKTASAAVDALIERGDEAKEQLKGEALEGNDLTRRGWAIVVLGEIGGDDVDALLKKVHEDTKQPELVRTWSAAARVQMTDTTEELIAKAELVKQFPALGRPIGMRLVEALNKDGEEVSAEGVLQVSLQVPQLQQALAPAILAMGSDQLSEVLVTAADQNVRRQAAAYLGTLAGQGDKGVGKAVIERYSFDAEAEDVAWNGGPLFVPGLQWNKEDAQALVGNLIKWHLWCDVNGKAAEQKQIHNNIRSLSLASAAGYKSPGFNEIDTASWLKIWKEAAGKAAVAEILKEQKLEDNPKYAKLLK